MFRAKKQDTPLYMYDTDMLCLNHNLKIFFFQNHLFSMKAEQAQCL